MANTKGLQGTGGFPPRGGGKGQRPSKSNQPGNGKTSGTQGTGGKLPGGKSILTG